MPAIQLKYEIKFDSCLNLSYKAFDFIEMHLGVSPGESVKIRRPAVLRILSFPEYDTIDPAVKGKLTLSCRP